MRWVETQYSVQKVKIDATKVSVIMPVYNRSYCIGNAIESIVEQWHSNWELLIVDDGSTESFHEIKKKYTNDNRIRFIHKPRGGVSQSRNVGLEQANGQYIFYLDTDNLWNANYLQTMLTFMVAGNLDVCYCGTRLIDDSAKTLGFYGEKFNWDECWELNYIDINSLGHRNMNDNQEIRFDESLKRLVDWDFLLTLTYKRRTAYAPFLGVVYYDGQQGNRITFTEFTGDEIETLKKFIRNRHYQKRFCSENAAKELRPGWQEISSQWKRQ